MKRLVPALIDVASGLLLVAVALAGARVLFQSPSRVYLFFPLLLGGALCLGWWRGRRDGLPAPLTALLTTLLLWAMALYFFSGRTRPVILLPVVAFVALWVGVVLARTHARWPAVAAVVLIAIVGGAFAGPRFVRLLVPSSDVNEAIGPFTIHLVDGRTIDSRDLRGRVVVLDFWATWCVPCQRELPIVQRVYDTMRSDPGVVFFAIDGVMTDSPGDASDTAERAMKYFERGRYTLPLAFDGGGVLETSLRLHGFPTLLVLDPEGRMRMRHVGFSGGEDLERTLTEKIRELERVRTPAL